MMMAFRYARVCMCACVNFSCRFVVLRGLGGVNPGSCHCLSLRILFSVVWIHICCEILCRVSSSTASTKGWRTRADLRTFTDSYSYSLIRCRCGLFYHAIHRYGLAILLLFVSWFYPFPPQRCRYGVSAVVKLTNILAWIH